MKEKGKFSDGYRPLKYQLDLDPSPCFRATSCNTCDSRAMTSRTTCRPAGRWPRRPTARSTSWTISPRPRSGRTPERWANTRMYGTYCTYRIQVILYIKYVFFIYCVLAEEEKWRKGAKGEIQRNKNRKQERKGKPLREEGTILEWRRMWILVHIYCMRTLNPLTSVYDECLRLVCPPWDRSCKCPRIKATKIWTTFLSFNLPLPLTVPRYLIEERKKHFPVRGGGTEGWKILWIRKSYDWLSANRPCLRKSKCANAR